MASPLSTRVSEFRSRVKVEVAVLGSPSLISFMVSVDVSNIESIKINESKRVE